MLSESYDIINAEIKELESEKRKILLLIKHNEEQFNTLSQKIKNLKLKFPTCYSCGNHYHPKEMYISTQEDVDNFYDKHEGYTKLEVGEFYCGC